MYVIMCASSCEKKLLLSVLLSYFFFNGFSMSSSPFECHLRATDGEKSARARDDLKSQPESFYLLSPISACKQQQQSFLSNEFLINSKRNETKRWCGERIKQVANRGDRQKKLESSCSFWPACNRQRRIILHARTLTCFCI